MIEFTKQRLLIGAAIMCCAAAHAKEQPEMIFGDALSGISPNGEWVAGLISDGDAIIRNLKTGEMWPYFSSGSRYYYVGYGTPVSNNGVVVGGTTTANASYWENGAWHPLPVPDRNFICNAVSITPDSGIICGGVGAAAFGGEDTENTMLFPGLWYRQEDGSYSDPIILPHPDKDMTGRAPQYISAIAISDDGKTVAGEITDYFGARTEPIVYRCDDDGNWSYLRLGEKMLNPSGIIFPEWPGGLPDDILMPTQEWYMTQEQIDAFVEAFNEWDNTGEPPHYEDFMTPEAVEEYRKDLQAYWDLVLPWQENFDKFMSLYKQYLSQGTSFARNQARLSPDGKYYVTSAGGQPVIFDTETGDVTILRSNARISVTSVAADYTIMGSISAPGADVGTFKAYIFPQMKEGGMLLEDFMKEINPEVFDWMEGHLLQDVIVGLNSDGSFATELMLCTGIPVSTPDMSWILTNNTVLSWVDDPGEEFLSVLLPTGLKLGSPQDPDEPQEPDTGAVNGIADSIQCDLAMVYDLGGNLVYTLKSPGTDDTGAILTGAGIPRGFYVVKTIYSDGSSRSCKICL